jgi:hypothetical protein
MGPWEIFGVVLACIACIACGYILYRNLQRLLASRNRATSKNVEQFSGLKKKFADGEIVDTRGAMGDEGGQLEGKWVPWTLPKGWVLTPKSDHKSVVRCVDNQLYVDSQLDYASHRWREPFQAYSGPQITQESIAKLKDVRVT